MYLHVPVIQQLRAQARILQREGDLQRPQTKEELKEVQKWLEWSVLFVSCQIICLKLCRGL